MDCVRGERRRAGRGVSVRSGREDAHAAVPRAREAAPGHARPDDVGALSLVGRPGDPGVPDAAEGRGPEGPSRDRAAAWRPVGARHVGLRRLRPVSRQPRLRGPAAELPRVDRLRPALPGCRQQAVGRQDAGRPHVGREVPRREGHRRPEAHRHLRRLLRRLRHARGRGVHARRVRGGRVAGRPVEPDHAARFHPRLLGGRPQGLLRAHGRPVDAGRQGPARAAVAAELGREDPHAAARHPGRERSQGEQGGVGSDRDRACATAGSPWSTSSRPTRGTASRGR